MITRNKLLGLAFVVVCLALLGWSYFCVGIPGIAEISLYNPSARSVLVDKCSGKSITVLPSQEIPELVRSALAAAEPISLEYYQAAAHSLCNSRRRPLRYVMDGLRLTQKLRIRFSQAEIQTIYANQGYFGEDAVGIEAAAQKLVHKNVSELTLGEAALLAGILRSPSRYSLARNPGAARDRRNQVLDLMKAQKLISAEQAQSAKDEPLPIHD